MRFSLSLSREKAEKNIMIAVPQRNLGSQGLVCSQIGIGCMGMTAFYGDFDRAAQEGESLKAIETALQQGINFFDTAWIYQSFGKGGGGNFTNEELLGKAIAKFGRSSFVIATKFGILPTFQLSGKEDAIKLQLTDSLQRLGIDYIDLYYQHRMDPSTPIEETMTVLKSLVTEGKIKYIGLSECSSSDLRRAHAVHPITAIQMEWSLQSRSIENDILKTARELGVGIVCYSPLGRGLLSKTFTSMKDIDSNDWRRSVPRFQEATFDTNLPTTFFSIAEKKGCTPAQLALAWLLKQGDDVFPIPGTKQASRVEENAKAAEVALRLSPEDLAEIEASVTQPVGDRYSDMGNLYENRL